MPPTNAAQPLSPSNTARYLKTSSFIPYAFSHLKTLAAPLAARFAIKERPVVTPAYHRKKSVISRRDALVMGNLKVLRLSVIFSVLLLPIQSESAQWAGHTATLSDARIACSDLESMVCLPYMAAAVAVSDLLSYQAKVVENTPDTAAVEIVFYMGDRKTCSVKWLRSLNGAMLLKTALSLPDTTQAHYWTEALRQAATSLCSF